MQKQTFVSRLTTDFIFDRIGTPADANGHKTFSCRYLSNNISTVVDEWTHGDFCLGCFSSSTHFGLVTRLAQKAWRQCVVVFVYDRFYHAGNCIRLLSNTGLFLSTGNKYLFLLQHRLSPFRLLTTTPEGVSILPCLASSFVIDVSDLYSSSPLSSTFDNWASTCSDESTCRTIPIRF